MKIALTKTVLSKFIKGTSSRYNVSKKIDVVNKAYEKLKNGGIWERIREESWNEMTYLHHFKMKPSGIGFKHFHQDPMIEYFDDSNVVFSFGTYCEGSVMAGTDYFVNVKEKYIARGVQQTNGKFDEEERLEFN